MSENKKHKHSNNDFQVDSYQEKLEKERDKRNLIINITNNSNKRSHKQFNKRIHKLATTEDERLSIFFTFIICGFLTIPVALDSSITLKILLTILLFIFSYSITRVLFKKKSKATLFAILSLLIGIPTIFITNNSKEFSGIFVIALIFFGSFLISLIQKQIRFIQNFITCLVLLLFSYFSFIWLEIYDLGILKNYLFYIFSLLCTFMIPFFFNISFKLKLIFSFTLNLIVFIIHFTIFNSLQFSIIKLLLFFFVTFISSLFGAILQEKNVNNIINSLAFTTLKIFMTFLGITSALTISLLF